MGSYIPYSKEEKKYIISLYKKGFLRKEILPKFIKKFPMRTLNGANGIYEKLFPYLKEKFNHGIYGFTYFVNKEQKEFIKKLGKKYKSHSLIQKEFLKKYPSTKLGYRKFSHLCFILGIKNNKKDTFKVRQINKNERFKIGYEFDNGSHILVKVKNGTKPKNCKDKKWDKKNLYVKKENVVYEKEYNDSINENEMIYFLDGNTKNFEKNNLIKAPKNRSFISIVRNFRQKIENQPIPRAFFEVALAQYELNKFRTNHGFSNKDRR